MYLLLIILIICVIINFCNIDLQKWWFSSYSLVNVINTYLLLSYFYKLVNDESIIYRVLLNIIIRNTRPLFGKSRTMCYIWKGDGPIYISEIHGSWCILFSKIYVIVSKNVLFFYIHPCPACSNAFFLYLTRTRACSSGFLNHFNYFYYHRSQNMLLRLMKNYIAHTWLYITIDNYILYNKNQSCHLWFLVLLLFYFSIVAFVLSLDSKLYIVTNLIE